MNLLRLIILFLYFLMVISAYTQEIPSDSALQLNEVVISASRLNDFSTASKIQMIDSTSLKLYKTGNLSNILENESPLYIKSYGPGSLATGSFRGGSANQTAILWNGFNLNNPMNGQTDFSLIPNSFINNVKIQYGGTSALWGSGAVGGSIHLNNTAQFNQCLTVTTGGFLGSYSNYGQNIGIEISKTKWISSIKLFNTSAKNDFKYYNIRISGSPEQKQTNAELKGYGFLSENYIRLSNRQKLHFHFWYQNTDRNIPPIMLQNISTANQKDESYRVSAQWQRNSKKIIWLARTAYFNEHYAYSDDSNYPSFLSRSQTFITETESKIMIHSSHLLNMGINNTFVKAESEGYESNPHQNSFALFASYRFQSKNKRLHAIASARQEMVSSLDIPATFSLASNYTISKWLKIKGSISKVYRLPSLNDIYWEPGGNINLLPENGYSEEAGIILKPSFKSNKIKLNSEITLFNRNVDNWIIWLPGGLSYWSPQNIMEVWSRGLETNNELLIIQKKLKISCRILTNYVVSTNEKPKTENDASVDKQLIYVPMYSGHGKLTLTYKKFLLGYNHSYTGYRYTSADNSEYLEPFMLGSIYASFTTRFDRYNLDIFFKVNNLYNEQYQLILNRAMPLRNYITGISIQFKPRHILFQSNNH